MATPMLWSVVGVCVDPVMPDRRPGPAELIGEAATGAPATRRCRGRSRPCAIGPPGRAAPPGNRGALAETLGDEQRRGCILPRTNPHTFPPPAGPWPCEADASRIHRCAAYRRAMG